MFGHSRVQPRLSKTQIQTFKHDRIMMKKGCLIAVAVVVLLGFALFGWGKGTYNSMVKSQEGVEAAWAQVENVYQRRADLIPNLVETVKGYAKHEKETLEGVINARAKATSVQVDASNLDEAQIKKFQEAQGELTQALSRLIAVSENYPDLKARTALLSSDRSSTTRLGLTTPRSVRSRPTSWLASSISTASPTSRPRPVPIRLQRCHSINAQCIV